MNFTSISKIETYLSDKMHLINVIIKLFLIRNNFFRCIFQKGKGLSLKSTYNSVSFDTHKVNIVKIYLFVYPYIENDPKCRDQQ
jgi:hypothetical protein